MERKGGGNFWWSRHRQKIEKTKYNIFRFVIDYLSFGGGVTHLYDEELD